MLSTCTPGTTFDGGINGVLNQTKVLSSIPVNSYTVGTHNNGTANVDCSFCAIGKAVQVEHIRLTLG